MSKTYIYNKILSMDAQIKNRSKKEICYLFSQIDGKKTLVLDKSIIPLIDALFGPKGNGIKTEIPSIIKIYYLEDIINPEETNCPNTFIYIVRSNSPKIQIIINQISLYPSATYYVYFIPRFGLLCAKKFEPLIDTKSFRELPHLSLVPQFHNLFTMHMPVSHVLLENPYIMHDVSHAIAHFAAYRKIFACTDINFNTPDIVKKVLDFSKTFSSNDQEIFINKLIIIDRRCDLITPLLSPKTYSGIIQEMSSNDKIYIPDNNDLIYDKIKHMNYLNVPEYLHTTNKQISEHKLIIAKATNMKIKISSAELTKITDFVIKHPTKVLAKHITNMEEIIKYHSSILHKYTDNENKLLMRKSIDDKYFEEFFKTTPELFKQLKLLCLMTKCGYYTSSNTNAILKKYGLKHIFAIQKLKEYGYDLMSTESEDSSDGKESMIDNIIREFSFENIQTMIIPSLIKKIINKKKISSDFSVTIHKNDKIQKQNNTCSNESLQTSRYTCSNESLQTSRYTYSNDNLQTNRNAFVFIIGGITYDEFYKIKEIFPDIYVGSTSIISGGEFMQSFL
jgi:hypothetical protein